MTYERVAWGGAHRIDPERMAIWRGFLETQSRLLDALSEELLTVEDLPLPWYDVLVQLSEAPDWQLEVERLREVVLVVRDGLAGIVEEMERAELVDLATSDDEPPRTFARLAPKGFATLKRCVPLHAEGVATRFTDLINDDEVATVRAVLERVVDHLAPPPASS